MCATNLKHVLIVQIVAYIPTAILPVLGINTGWNKRKNTKKNGTNNAH